ncbi:MAG: hypothetical protein KF770_09545 [Anaerolineae bacterium]|nr:hypothetical protein [Anaerolineae bacterium]
MKIQLIFIGTIIATALIGCGSKVPPNENLPEGMEGGLWMSPTSYGDEVNLVFFRDGAVVDGDGEKGTYDLMADGQIMFQFSDWSEQMEIAQAKSGDRIVASSEEMGDVPLDLVVRDTNTADLEDSIIGEWYHVDELFYFPQEYLDEVNHWVIERDGKLTLTPGAAWGEEPIVGSYEWVGDKLVLDLEREGTLIFTVLSIGELLYLHQSDEDYGFFLVSEKVKDILFAADPD